MNNESSFFSDPKVIISLIAILISIVNLIWTLNNQWEQNRRWDKLNTANVILKDAKLIRWKKISKDEAMATNWGYDPLIFGSGELDEQYILPYKLVARDANSQNLISTINSCFTIDEVKSELKRVGYKGQVNIFKNFKVKFEIENRGKTDANELDLKVKAKHDNLDWQDAFTANSKIILSSDQISTITFDFDFPVNTKLPDEIYFKIIMNYKDINNNSIDKEINSKWTSNDNFWSYSNK